MSLIRVLLSFCLMLLLLLGNNDAQAGELAEHLAKFPQWEKLTSVKPAKGDLVYPEWMSGTWKVTSTLVDLAAPLAPDIVTPGFEGNRSQLNQPISFLVKFIKVKPTNSGLKFLTNFQNQPSILVADREFNSLNLSRAYLGDDTVLSSKVDPQSPNRQITFLRGERQLISIISDRTTETPADDQFITTEVFQQLFQGSPRPYLNTVESTTAYQKLSTSSPAITADQVTAVYLSSQDPDYFTAGSQPVALYRYRLKFVPAS
ncbi:DUF6816 family protein [Dolichospermum sp. UHCC 0259]|uniref:DUF6816 family protein n=1 Tax=Dolichospermum sp. UHCC 0259 TaxID=2590010 RepID=UPI001447927D|nr:hypothetical protein [Dolichospermum sp. UHCC 0259]MTJ48467.1 hypothetical protein [Dolichospermum sp. UHCC 0259]